MGDINVGAMTVNENTLKLEEALLGDDLRRLKLPPTRITHSSQTSIDFICTNMSEADISTQVLDTGISDHCAQLCNINTDKRLIPAQTLTRKINKERERERERERETLFYNYQN
ncbi:hypothetical protein J6590_085499 [Homalodisca vitripennis]|nr:hypothetical protein J6590_085499 [Homalodisca vitripennis]